MRTPRLTALLVTTVLAAFLSVSCSGNGEKKKGPVYRIGYMICNSTEETMHRFAPLTAWLGKRLGARFEAVPIDTVRFSERIKDLDFTHTNSLLYIMFHRYYGLDILAVEKRGELGDRSRGLVAVLKKSGIKDIKDLRGKSMIFGPMLAPTGYLSQIYAMKKLGFDPDEELAFSTIPTGAFKHEKVIYGVYFGKYDAGAFPYYDFELMDRQGKIKREDFRILAKGPLIPYCNFAVTQKVDDSLARRFRAALLSLTPEDTVEFAGERVRVLARAGLDGFSPAEDADFDTLREMAKATNMPPYQDY